MISGSNKELRQQLEYALHGWWILKMQSGREDTLEERYAIKFCFKLGKNAATEMYGKLQTAFGPSCMNRAQSKLSSMLPNPIPPSFLDISGM